MIGRKKAQKAQKLRRQEVALPKLDRFESVHGNFLRRPFLRLLRFFAAINGSNPDELKRRKSLSSHPTSSRGAIGKAGQSCLNGFDAGG